MASSIDTSTYSVDNSLSRKRKQDSSPDVSKSSSSATPIANTAWSDYVRSSPNSPSISAMAANNASALTSGSSIRLSSLAAPDEMSLDSNYHNNLTGFDLNLDSIFSSSGSSSHFDHNFDFDQYDFESHLPLSGSASRRHSVAVGELDFHSFETVKQELDMKRFDASLQQLLASPSAWSTITTTNYPDINEDDNNHISERPLLHEYHHQQLRPTHKRAMSLRLETSLPFQDHTSASPDTPSLFTPSFLEALNADEDKDTPLLFPSGSISFTKAMPLAEAEKQHQDITSNLLNMSSSSSSSSTEFLLQQQCHHHQNSMQTNGANTIAPSAISNDLQSMQTWVYDQKEMQQLRKEEVVVKTHVSRMSRPSPPASPSNTMSSSSSSPPITPMQPVLVNTNPNSSYDHLIMSENHYHPPIPEEEDEHTPEYQHQHHGATTGISSWPVRSDQQKMQNSSSSLVTARVFQGATTASVLKPHVQQYLMSNDPAGSGEHTVMILTSKVAQKSYGTEKRFLCPPPTTVLSGSCWWTNNRATKDGNNHQNLHPGAPTPPGLTIYISGEATSQTGVLEWYDRNGITLETPSSAAAATESGDAMMSGRCVSKHLHINDADEKRKRVEILIKMQLGNGLQLGTFCSKGIKVISKPSKKRQSLKNMELCIHHGTTISLFNRIRSQTVSTKYLGVSNNVPVQGKSGTGAGPGNGTCFVARTGSWDPFVIWIVDTSRAPKVTTIPRKHHPTNSNYPPPPAIALQQVDTTNQYPLAIHYNQAVVLQCVTTGLVSPVMVIRKVDKGSMVLGGNRLDDLSGSTGGECGDEALGDPVSQLHKVAFQIVQDPSIAHNNKAGYRRKEHADLPSSYVEEWRLPQSCNPIAYLACLNDVVGMHKTTSARTLIAQRAPVPPKDVPSPSSWLEHGAASNSKFVVAQDEGKVVRKRRVSCDVTSSKPISLPAKLQSGMMAAHRRRVNSLGDVPALTGRRGSASSTIDRRGSIDGGSGQLQTDGSCWTEDVSDAAVWTIVGTDCATYTFWTPPPLGEPDLNTHFHNVFGSDDGNGPITPFPTVHQANCPTAGGDTGNMFILTGDNFSHDLSIWFGDIEAPHTEYQSRESISCSLPDLSELLSSPVITVDEADGERRLPLLLVRGDGIVYRTGKFYSF